MILLKNGVTISVLTPQMVLGCLIAYSVFKDRGSDCTITAGDDGTHMPGSLHYTGNAVDVRSRDLQPETRQQMLTALKTALGPNFDALLESDHFHIEYDPKLPTPKGSPHV